MLGNHNLQVEQFILDTSTISQIFSAFHPPLFPTLWEYFDRLVLSGFAISVAAVRAELQALGRVAGAVAYLESLNQQFFASPTQDEQYLVEEMTANNALTSSSNRWRSKTTRGFVDADPYLIAKGLVAPVLSIVVTEESQDLTKRDRIFYVCHYYGLECINHRQMMVDRIGWRF
ncbi:MAG: DUF4411 family protein [Chloroflexi bacterium]|nr:DUF4411 family protein [Chloroflexota bacterium]